MDYLYLDNVLLNNSYILRGSPTWKPISIWPLHILMSIGCFVTGMVGNFPDFGIILTHIWRPRSGSSG